MTDIIEAAAQALQGELISINPTREPPTWDGVARAVLAAVTPLIRAAALEEAAQLTEKYRAGAYEARQRIAAAIRALKTSG